MSWSRTKPLPQRFWFSRSGRSTLSFPGLDLRVQHLAEVRLKYGSALKGPVGLRAGEKSRGAGNHDNWDAIFKEAAGSTTEPTSHTTQGSILWISGSEIHCDWEVSDVIQGHLQTVWLRLPFATRASLLNVKCHKSRENHLWKVFWLHTSHCVLEAGSSACAPYTYTRPWHYHPPCRLVSKAHVQAWPRLSIPLQFTSQWPRRSSPTPRSVSAA